MSGEILQALTVIGGSIAVVTFVGSALTNILYSKPRVEKLQAEQVASGKLVAGLQAQNTEQGAQIRVLQQGPMDAIRELAGAVAIMSESIKGDGTAIVAELRKMRETATSEHSALVTAIGELHDARPHR